MTTMAKFVVGVIIVVGLIGVCSERVTVGKAEALDRYEFSPSEIRAAAALPAECETETPCILWRRDWHPQQQRISGSVTTVEVYSWRCVEWRNTPGHSPATEPFCRNQVRKGGTIDPARTRNDHRRLLAPGGLFYSINTLTLTLSLGGRGKSEYMTLSLGWRGKLIIPSPLRGERVRVRGITN